MAMKIAVILHTTFTRFEMAKKTIESFRYDDRFRLYVADTGPVTPEKIDYYRSLESRTHANGDSGHKTFFCGWDTSPAITRNFLVDLIEEDYVMKIDDDFELKYESFSIDDVLKMFEMDTSVGLIGFGVYSVRWESKFLYDIQKDHETLILNKQRGNAEEWEGQRFVRCDVTPDCWIARRQIFPECNWDERYHVCEGLHTDFFAQIKYNSPWNVIYLPDQRIYTFKHDPEWEQTKEERQNSFYNKKRFRHMDAKRQVDYSKFKQKWGIKAFIK